MTVHQNFSLPLAVGRTLQAMANECADIIVSEESQLPIALSGRAASGSGADQARSGFSIPDSWYSPYDVRQL